MSSTIAIHPAAVDAAIAQLAASQAGAFSVEQAVALGATPSLIRRRRQTGRWERLTTNVLAIAGTPPTELRRRWAIRLSLGDRMVVSHEWAGRLRRLPAIHDDVWSVTVPTADHRRRSGFIVHQQGLVLADVGLVDGFATTTVARTVCDLATVTSTARLRQIVDASAFDLGCSFESLWATLLRTGTVGRPGASQLTALLHDRRPGHNVQTTKLEAMLADVLDLTDLPSGVPQHPLPGAAGRSGFVDRAFPEATLILEADGRRWHARAEAMVTDRQRDIEAARRGWQTLRVMHEQLSGDPVDTAAAIAETYHRRLVER